MTEPLTAERLDAIRERADRWKRTLTMSDTHASAKDVPALLTEVARQSAELDALRIPVDPAYDGEMIEQTATWLAHRGHADGAAAVRNLAAITDRLTAELATKRAEVQQRGKAIAAAIALNTTLTRELELRRRREHVLSEGLNAVRDMCAPLPGQAGRMLTVLRSNMATAVTTAGQALDAVAAAAALSPAAQAEGALCDAAGHDPIECSCELTAADAPVGMAVRSEPRPWLPSSTIRRGTGNDRHWTFVECKPCKFSRTAISYAQAEMTALQHDEDHNRGATPPEHPVAAPVVAESPPAYFVDEHDQAVMAVVAEATQAERGPCRPCGSSDGYRWEQGVGSGDYVRVPCCAAPVAVPAAAADGPVA